MSYFLRRLLLKDSKSNRSLALTLTPTHFSAAAFSSDAAEEREARLERGSKETPRAQSTLRARARAQTYLIPPIRIRDNSLSR